MLVWAGVLVVSCKLKKVENKVHEIDAETKIDKKMIILFFCILLPNFSIRVGVMFLELLLVHFNVVKNYFYKFDILSES